MNDDPDCWEPERAICVACGGECSVIIDTDSDGVDAWQMGYTVKVSDCCGDLTREHTAEELEA